MKSVSLCAIFEKTNIFKKYKEFKAMFVNNINNLLLPQHEEWDYKIILKSKIKPTFGLIYFLSEKKLKVLKKYLNDNLKKRHIRFSTFPAEYPIFFVRKKDGT